jgi:hypothetical protein
LFLAIGASEFHIAEMAHIISVGEKAARFDSHLSDSEKGDFFNLILLCPTCHTKIDKAESEFPDSLIKEWKSKHSEKIKALFGIKHFSDRKQAKLAVEPILLENKTIFNIYGPETDERVNPESEMPKRWKSKIHSHILPNNRKILNILDMNSHLLNAKERDLKEIYRQHVLDFEAKHLSNENIDGIQLPPGFSRCFFLASKIMSAFTWIINKLKDYDNIKSTDVLNDNFLKIARKKGPTLTVTTSPLSKLMALTSKVFSKKTMRILSYIR